MPNDSSTLSFFPEYCIIPKSGTIAPNGFIVFNVGGTESGVTQSAQRLAYRLFIGHIPPKHLIMQSCETKVCINPRHLYLGTSKDGGHKSGKKTNGEKNWQAVLTDEIVHTILASNESSKVLAAEYGVTRQCISRIRAGISWRHIPRP